MAITNASRLAKFAGGTKNVPIEADSTNKRIGLGTTSANSVGTIGAVGASGTSLFVHGDANITGTTTVTTLVATTLKGDGSSLTGVSGFGTALDSTQNTFGNLIFKTPYEYTITAGTSERITSDTTSGGVAFTRLGNITVANGSTVTVSSGTSFVMDVLSIFP